ncbi:MAG: serine protease [Alphaproteobacteria bacterium]|nr:serine protease [Alphaproteobacteria bacterium]
MGSSGRIVLIIVILVGVGLVNRMFGGGGDVRRPAVDAFAPPPTIEQAPPPGQPLPQASPLDPEFVVEKEAPAPSTGTAFAIDDGGIWMTARHVVEGCTEIGILTGPRRGLKVRRVLSEPGADVSVLWTGRGAPPLALTLSPDVLRVGQEGFHVGYPGGRPGDAYSSLIGRSRLRTVGRGVRTVEPTIAWSERRRQPQFDSLGGMSGGPVLDDSGRVVGVTVAASIRRGRIISAAPVSMANAVRRASLRLPGGAGVGADAGLPSAQTFPRYGTRLRRELTVAKVVCLVDGHRRRRR